MSRVRPLKQPVLDLSSGVIAAVLFLVLVYVLNIALWMAAVIALLSFVSVVMLFRPTPREVNIELDAETRDYQEKTVWDGYQKLGQIGRCIDQITTAPVREKAERIRQSITKILDYLKKNPGKVKHAHSFFTYYLETTALILQKYLELSGQKLNDPEIAGTLQKVEGLLDTLADSFDKQLSRLMENEVMDLESEISLLESTIKSEGL